MENPPRYTFKPLRRVAKARPLAAFDTVGTGEPGHFVCGSVVSPHGRFVFADRHDMLEYLTSPPLRGAWLFAHNLEYDIGVLTGGDLRAFTCLFTETRILKAETQDRHGHEWLFLDSLNLFPHFSIADLGRLVGLPKLELPGHLKKLLREAHALADFEPGDADLITDYCLRDADILYAALTSLQDELLSMGGALASTIAGSSMDLFRRRYLVDPWPVPHPGINNLARQAYYGARTEPYRLGLSRGVNAYDVNSLYPSVQRDAEFPWPGDLQIYPGGLTSLKMLEKPGLSQCRVFVPDLDPPPLPQRVGQHLFFPTGELRGAWMHQELRHALARGVQLKEIEWSLVSASTFNPFGEFIDALYARRQLHASSSPMRASIFKLLLNSAYGRYGLNPEAGLSVLLPLPADPDWDELSGGEIRLINDVPYVLLPLGDGRQPAYVNVPIAASITAGARIRMHEYLEQRVEQMIYTDTDSLFIEGELPTGGALGEMKQIHAGVDLWCIAPKEYAVFSAEALLDVHAKGIPELYRLQYLKTGRALFERPVRIREAARWNVSPASWTMQLKRRGYQVPKRAPDLHLQEGLEYYPTRAWALAEIESLLQCPQEAPKLSLTCLAP